MENLVQARGLSRSFGARQVVDGLDLSVARGDVLGFLGPNGAGKTTTMRMLTGYLAPSAGEIRICGQSMTPHSVALRKHIGYLPEGAPLYGHMTVGDFLNFVASSHGIRGSERKLVTASAVETLHLEQVYFQEIHTLSKGFKRRVGLAAAILHAPEVLILDEPTDGLDPNQKHEVRRLIETMAVDRAIIISTHILEEVDALCSRVVVMDHGRLVASDTPSGLRSKSRYRGAVTILLGRDVAMEARDVLAGLDDVVRVDHLHEAEHVRLTILPRGGCEISEQVGDMVASKPWTVHGFNLEAGRLDDVFRSLTKGDVR